MASNQEVLQLASVNVAGAPSTVYGGDYIFNQTATSYGTLALQCLGPDGATWQTLISKAVSDTGGGVGITLGSNAIVKVVLTGTVGANATLSRVP